MEVTEISEEEAKLRMVKRSISDGLRQGLYIPAQQKNYFAQVALAQLVREGVATLQSDARGEHVVRS